MTFILNGLAEDEKFKAHLEIVADSTFNRIKFQAYKSAYHSGELTPMNRFISKGSVV